MERDGCGGWPEGGTVGGRAAVGGRGRGREGQLEEVSAGVARRGMGRGCASKEG